MLCWDAQNVAEPHNGGAAALYIPTDLGADPAVTWALYRLKSPPNVNSYGTLNWRRWGPVEAGGPSDCRKWQRCWRSCCCSPASQALTGLLAAGLIPALPRLPASLLLVPIRQISLNTCTSCTQLHPNCAADVSRCLDHLTPPDSRKVKCRPQK